MGENDFALKLDMSKAYDIVEWGFVESIMMKLGFRDSWIRKIMSCTFSVSFFFKINGNVCENVILSRGLRQGNPISPYLFILCADSFSTLISQARHRKTIHGVKVCRGAPPTLTFFLCR